MMDRIYQIYINRNKDSFFCNKHFKATSAL